MFVKIFFWITCIGYGAWQARKLGMKLEQIFGKQSSYKGEEWGK